MKSGESGIINRKENTKISYIANELGRYALLYEENPVMNFILNSDFKISSVNKFGAENLGYTQIELQGSDVFSVIHDEDKKNELKCFNECLVPENLGKLYNRNFRIFRKNGEIIWVNEHVRSIEDENGEKFLLTVCQDITNQIEAEIELKVLKQGIENTNDAVIFFNLNNKVTYTNKEFCNKFELDINNIIGSTPNKIFKADDADKFSSSMSNETYSNGSWKGVINYTNTLGFLITVEFKTSLITNENGKVIGYVAIGRDISALKEKQKLLSESLKQKELLLKEVHHRVKNNLQTVVGLLSFEEKYIKDPNSFKIFTDSKNRIKTISLIHENLYHAADISRVDISLYLNNLVQYLLYTYNMASKKLDYKIKCENVFLGIDTAMPIGLIVNELVTNSMKYAFPDNKSGLILVDLSYGKDIENFFTLTVSDNGIGIGEEINLKEIKSLGLQLVYMLSEQLNAVIQLNNENGTCFKILFSSLKYNKRT